MPARPFNEMCGTTPSLKELHTWDSDSRGPHTCWLCSRRSSWHPARATSSVRP